MEREVLNPPELFDSLQYGFSQAVAVADGRRLFLSGQVATDRDEVTAEAGFLAQLEQSFDNIELALAAAGGSLADVAMLRLYIAQSADADLDGVVEVLRRRFPVDPPAATWLVVSGFAREDWLVEVEAEALLAS